MTTGPAPDSSASARKEAAALDGSDELQAFRAEFVFPQKHGRDVVYLTGNSLGLLPVKAKTTVMAELEAWGRLGVEGHFAAPGASFDEPLRHGPLPEERGPAEPWYSYHTLFAERGAALVGARPDEVVAMGSLTVNLHLLMVSFYRPTKQRHRIVIEKGAFPSDRYLVQSQARFHGFDPQSAIVELAPRAGEDLLRTEDVLAFIDNEGDDVALFLMGGVNYYTGQLFDIGSITKAARARGIVVGWDLAHAAGNVPLSLHDDDVDFAAWCSYKYLNSGPGSVAMAFVHERHAQAYDLPRFCGWWSTHPKTRFQMKEMELAPGAPGWQISNAPILSMAALHASLDVFHRAGLDRLRNKSIALTGFLERLLVEVPGVFVITPRDPAQRGAQLSLRVRVEPEKLARLLHERGVVVDFRRPDVIRAAPAPLYCRFDDVVRFVDVLKECVQ